MVSRRWSAGSSVVYTLDPEERNWCRHRGDPHQRFVDDVRRRDGDAEELVGHARDGAMALVAAALAGQGGTGADDLQVMAGLLPHAAEQHGDVRALPAAVVVQFVE